MKITLPRATAILIATWLVVVVLPLGAKPLVAPDETRYALIGWEMSQTTDWFALRMNGFRYYEKPPLAYWMIAGSFRLFGETPFALRLPSALAALGWSMVGLLLAWRWRRDGALACVAGLASLTMLAPIVIATTAVLDGPFSAFVAGTILAAGLAARSIRPLDRVGWAMVAGVLSGLSLLSKGFVGLALPAMVILPWLVSRREWRSTLLALPALVGLAIAVLPPALKLHEAEPAFWHQFFWVEHVRRFTSPDGNQHAEPWWYYLALLPILTFPWVLNAPAALRACTARWRSDAWMQLVVAWIVIPFAFFSMAGGKLPTYVLPCFPAIGALFAVGMGDALLPARVRGSRPVRSVGPAVLLLLGAFVGVEMLTGFAGWPAGRIWTEAPLPKAAMVVATFMAWAAIDWMASSTAQRDRRLLLRALGAAPLALAVGCLIPSALLSQSKTPMPWLAPHRAMLAKATSIGSDANWAHAVGLAARRVDAAILGGPSEFDNELGDPRESARLIDPEEFGTWLAVARGRGDVAIVVDPERQAPLQRAILVHEARGVVVANEPRLRIVHWESLSPRNGDRD